MTGSSPTWPEKIILIWEESGGEPWEPCQYPPSFLDGPAKARQVHLRIDTKVAQPARSGARTTRTTEGVKVSGRTVGFHTGAAPPNPFSRATNQFRRGAIGVVPGMCTREVLGWTELRLRLLIA